MIRRVAHVGEAREEFVAKHSVGSWDLRLTSPRPSSGATSP
jgi:hypothetical protein